MQLQLPMPSPDALAASQALCNLIANEIERQSGWISFARYMELALYAPGIGYYSGGAAKLGKDGDFTTAPEITPLFGQTLARFVADLMPQTGPVVLEFGAGSGKLARDVLDECATMGTKIEEYLIVELSGELRARQQELLRPYSQVRWLDSLPDGFTGIVLGNEVLDAMPVELVVKSENGWLQRGVALSHAEQSSGPFRFVDRPCPQALLEQIPDADSLPLGYLTEVHPAATGFMRSIAQMLRRGASGGKAAALFIDYGFPAHEFYLGQRSEGTLMCHYRHHSHDDPFFLPGLQDITAHVDFSAIAQAAVESGLDVLVYGSQAGFLIDAGIGDLLMRTSPEAPLRYLPQSNALQRLVSPAEMGELFKVIVLGHGVDIPAAYSRSNRSHRL